MVQRGKGVIINMASVSGLKVHLNRTAYSVSKAGVIMLTRMLAHELGRYNIRVNAIAPGLVKTPMTERLLSDPEATQMFLGDTPLRGIGEPSDIIGTALFLASDAANWITGQTVIVDGGRLA